MNTCGTCRAFLAYDGDPVGSCQLHPPVPTDHAMWLFPPVHPDAWCLDWQPRDLVPKDGSLLFEIEPLPPTTVD